MCTFSLVLCVKQFQFYPYKPSGLFVGTYANSADQDQTSQNAASDQGLHFLLTEFSIKIRIKMENADREGDNVIGPCMVL